MAKRAAADLDERLKHAKGFVNARRKELGLRATGKLSKAYLVVGPIAQSLEAVGVTVAYPYENLVVLQGLKQSGERGTLVYEDSETAQFMRDFQAGAYPELQISPKPVKINKEIVLHG